MPNYRSCGTSVRKDCKDKPKGCVPVRVWDCKEAQKACTVVLHEGWLYGVKVDTPANEAMPLGHDNYTKAMTFDKAVAWLKACSGDTAEGGSTTVDEGCGRKITTDDNESTIVQGAKYFQRKQVGDTIHRTLGVTGELTPIIINKSDCCADFGNGVFLDIQANARVDKQGKPDSEAKAKIGYTIVSGYGEEAGDPTTADANYADQLIKSNESHPYVLPWDANGVITIIPNVEDFPSEEDAAAAFVSMQVYAYGCVCSDFTSAAQ